jgi:hypothetical protein
MKTVDHPTFCFHYNANTENFKTATVNIFSRRNTIKSKLTEIQKHYRKLQAAMAARPFLARAEKRAATAGSD